jgi:hypothetical protein
MEDLLARRDAAEMRYEEIERGEYSIDELKKAERELSEAYAEWINAYLATKHTAAKEPTR